MCFSIITDLMSLNNVLNILLNYIYMIFSLILVFLITSYRLFIPNSILTLVITSDSLSKTVDVEGWKSWSLANLLAEEFSLM